MPLKTPLYQDIVSFFYINFNLIYESNGKLENLFVKAIDSEIQKLENIYDLEPIFLNWNAYKFPVFIYNNATELINEEGKINLTLR